ncbi:hypothetical protein M432DRAFT_363854 [Thermoascus aurantiacus ATCC 26904]
MTSQETEPSSDRPGSGSRTRPATVQDMIAWLRLDGFYRGLVGWSTEYTMQEMFGPLPGPDDTPHVLGLPVKAPPLHHEEEGAAPETGPPQQHDFGDGGGVNAAFRELSRQTEEEKYVRRMVERHKRLIPAAVREIDRMLVAAGVSADEVQRIGGAADAASSVYAKLQRLEEVTKTGPDNNNNNPPPPPPRLKIQVVCDVGGLERKNNGLWKLDLYIPRNCTFDEFEDILDRHAYVRGLAEAPQAVHNSVAYEEVNSSSSSSVLKGKYVRGKVWGYRIVSQEETDIPVANDGTWQALCGQDDFTELMRVVVRDPSKLAVICHVSCLIILIILMYYYCSQ